MKKYAALTTVLLLIVILFCFLAANVFPADEPADNFLVFTEPSAEDAAKDYQTEVIAEKPDSESQPTVSIETETVETVASMPQQSDVGADISVIYEDVTETVYVLTAVNVRIGPGTDFSVLGISPYGSSIIRTGIGSNGWSRVIYNGEAAYIASEYLSVNREDVLAIEPDNKPDEQYDVDDSVARVLELVNFYRGQSGLISLKLSNELCDAANIRAQEITQVFDHTRPDGKDCFSVSPLAYGENIAMGTEMDADMAMNSWMNSQGHRENILDDSFVTIGIGYCYTGRNGYWVQLFGH